MLKYAIRESKGDRSVYGLTDEGETIALVNVNKNTIESVEYLAESARTRYREFLLRSAVFVLRNKFPVVNVAFSDETFRRLGFTDSENGGMSAQSIEISFDACCRDEGEDR